MAERSSPTRRTCERAARTCGRNYARVVASRGEVKVVKTTVPRGHSGAPLPAPLGAPRTTPTCPQSRRQAPAPAPESGTESGTSGVRNIRVRNIRVRNMAARDLGAAQWCCHHAAPPWYRAATAPRRRDAEAAGVLRLDSLQSCMRAEITRPCMERMIQDLSEELPTFCGAAPVQLSGSLL